LDPFFGNLQDPQSLHKYLYVHANPVNFIDPTGLFWYWAELGKVVHRQINAMYAAAHPGQLFTFGESLPGIGGAILPDIVNFDKGMIGEIKPFSTYGLATGPIQLTAALALANGAINITYRGKTILGGPPIRHRGPQSNWIPETWNPGVRMLWPGTLDPRFKGRIAFTLGNVDGIIFYTTFRMPTTDPILALGVLYAVGTELGHLWEQIKLDLRGVSDAARPAVELIWQYRLQAIWTMFVGIGLGIGGRSLTAAANKLYISTIQFFNGSPTGALVGVG
jgi:hypothetical protein